jgi:dipeptidyl-peptidase-4
VTDSFPRQLARTRRFSLGAPRSFRVAVDGRRIVFLRSPAGDEPTTSLWVFDAATGQERLAVDAASLGAAGPETVEERARRERARERAGGIVTYSVDQQAERALFVVAGTAWLADLAGTGASRLDLPTPEVFDARLDPTGRRLAWCSAGGLWVAELTSGGAVATGSARRLAGGEGPDIRWGQAEFAAAEEMGRSDGYWWAPDGSRLLAARVDDTPLPTAWIADPAHPEHPPVAHRYPFAGSRDAAVGLWLVDLDGSRRQVKWDAGTHPYVPEVRWPSAGDASPLVLVEQRNHRGAQVLAVGEDGSTGVVAERHDRAWLSWAPGTPDRLADGRLLWSNDLEGTCRLTVDGEAVTPPGLQVRTVVHAGDNVLFTASSEPTTVELWRWSVGGIETLQRGGVVTAAAAGGGTVVVATAALDRTGAEVEVLTGGSPEPLRIASLAATPSLTPSVDIRTVGPDHLRVALVLPTGHRPGGRLPVLMHPYGGPGAQRVLSARSAWLEDQWWADQGFAVVVVDGRGTPGRGPAWERAVHGDLAGPVLDDQIAGLQALAAEVPDLDLGRVGIMGWSFGGYLAALAVLRRPDVFHAAVAGAPVTEWRLYDTYYTERFLGHPGEDPGPYDRSSLLPLAAQLRRPLMAIHGLADDNVLVAHTLQLSQRLLEAGRPHTVLPLTGITHMPVQEDVAENLLLVQLRFLTDALADIASAG